MLFALLLTSSHLHAQDVGQEVFCGKKWYCEMTKDPDGTPHPPEKGSENDYMLFACDSNFTLAEKGTILKGKWVFDKEKSILTLIQSQISTMPERISFHFMEYDDSHLVMVGQSGTNSESTVYFITK
jgi:hypothetical protein